jgi:hypothetical protein
MKCLYELFINANVTDANDVFGICFDALQRVRDGLRSEVNF